jgi:hypothetical protein
MGIFDAILGRKASRKGNCSCHTADSLDLTGVNPEVADMLRTLASPDKQDELLKQMKANEAPSTPNACVHLDYIPVCHCDDTDTKPEWCSSSQCPVRMYQVVIEQMRKNAALIAYG